MATTKTKKKNAAKKAVETNAPNIKYVGRRKLSNKKYEDLDAPREFNTGMDNYPLPDTDTQKKGFYLPPKVARALATEHPTLYKLIRAKGTKSVAAVRKTEKAEVKKVENNKVEVNR